MQKIKYTLSTVWGAIRVGLVMGILLYVVAVMFNIDLSFAGGRSRPVVVEPSPSSTPLISPTASPSPVPAPSGSPFATLDPVGTTWNKTQAQAAINTMNDVVNSGCLKTKALLTDGFRSFNTVFEVSPKTALAAYSEYVAKAPYQLTVRTYYTRSKVYGYTFNFKNDSNAAWESGESETRVWTNTRYSWTSDELASHWFHETSHQARAGGFVHYTIHQGSFPYEIGDLAAECIEDMRRPVGRMMLMGLTPKPKARARGELELVY